LPPQGQRFEYAPAKPGLDYPPGQEDFEPPTRVQDFATTGRGKRRAGRTRSVRREVLTLLGIALLMTFLIQAFLGRFYLIPSGSMEKTLHGCSGCTNDRVLVDKLTYAFTEPQPGDVVVFEAPDSWSDDYDQATTSSNVAVGAIQQIGALIGLAPPDENDFVKRVIAVGGQTVQCCDAKGRVLVDHKPLTEPYIYWQGGKPNSRQQFDPVTVPKGTIWVMGDNRNNSKDSRRQGGGGIHGVVPIDNVIGKARYVVLPFSRWRGVGDHDPQGDTPTALGAPAWQQGLPAGVGFLLAWPTLWVSRRAGRLIRPRRRVDLLEESTVDPEPDAEPDPER
jgi:signal peptidase I